MTINQYFTHSYKGIAADIKPSTGIPIGSEFIETDTQDVYLWTGNAWVLRGTLSGKFYDENTATYKGFSFNSEAPQVCAQSYLHAISEGDISGHANFSKYGRMSAASNIPIDVWTLGTSGSATYPFPSSNGQGVRVLSDSSRDTSTSIGAYKIMILCLNTDYNSTSVEVTLSGTSMVTAGSTSISRINDIYVSQCGTQYAAYGNIDVCATGSTTTYARVDAGLNQSRSSVYTVPSSKTLYITSLRTGSGIGGTSVKLQYVIFTLKASVNPEGTVTPGQFFPKAEMGTMNGAIELDFEVPEKIPATADIKVTVQGDTTGGASCTAAFRGWIE